MYWSRDALFSILQTEHFQSVFGAFLTVFGVVEVATLVRIGS